MEARKAGAEGKSDLRLPNQETDKTCAGNNELTYAPSKKHHQSGWGTLMDLSDKEAQKVLSSSVQGGKQRYGVNDGKVYEFKSDNAGGWHGYPVIGTEVPPKVLRELLSCGNINRNEYSSLIRGKR